MTADHRGESGQQRTVAELLKQYGGDESSNGRRRRRAAEPDEPPGIPPVQRSEELDSGGYPVNDAEPVSGSGGYPAGGDSTGQPVSSSGSFEAAFDYDYDRNHSSNLDRDYDRDYDFDYDRPSGTGGLPAEGYGDPARSFGSAPAGYDEPGLGSPGSPTGGWPGGSDPSPPAAPNTGSFPAQAYRGDIYQGGHSGPPTAPGLAGGISGREDSTDFIPRYGNPDTAGRPPASEDHLPDIEAPGAGARVLDGVHGGGVLGSGPHTAVSSRAEMFDDEDDDGGPGTTVSSRAEMFDDDEPDDGGPHTAVSSPAEMFDDEDDEHESAPDEQAEPDEQPAQASGFLGRRLRRTKVAVPEPDAAEAAGHEPDEDLFSPGARRSAAPDAEALDDDELPAGLTEQDDARSVAQAGQPSAVKAWLMLIGQLVFATILGAALWIGFRYLWLNLPVVALGAAVLATAGLVLLVRAIRRSDDLQTTMLAVLVGLVVTISPAVLLLTDR